MSSIGNTHLSAGFQTHPSVMDRLKKFDKWRKNQRIKEEKRRRRKELKGKIMAFLRHLLT